MQKPESGSTTLSRPPLSDGDDGHAGAARKHRREHGRFVSAYGMHIVSGPPGQPVSGDWCSIVKAAHVALATLEQDHFVVVVGPLRRVGGKAFGQPIEQLPVRRGLRHAGGHPKQS